jgi:putative component of membrane protein insertase Oxa1/YidC/SpoIIIJ protein YidD
MSTEFPTQEEQDKVWEYCCKRPLNRPRVKIGAICLTVFLFLAVNCFLAFFFQRYTKFSFMAAFILFITISVCFYARKIIVGLVMLYQHYAPEYMRRRCLLMPTCSEYMILAVEKYGVIRGMYKGINRLFTRCCGNVYRIDYP